MTKVKAGMKAAIYCLVDDVKRLNTSLITKLNDHDQIDSAGHFNDYVYGKSKSGKRLRFILPG